MALSQLQVAVLRAVASRGETSVAALVEARSRDGVWLPVARASVSRSLRRLWRVGCVELHGRRGALTAAAAMQYQMAYPDHRPTRRRQASYVWFMEGKALERPRIPSLHVKTVRATDAGRSVLWGVDQGHERVWNRRPPARLLRNGRRAWRVLLDAAFR